MNTYKKHQQARKAFWNKFAQKKIVLDPSTSLPSFSKLEYDFVHEHETELNGLYSLSKEKYGIKNKLIRRLQISEMTSIGLSVILLFISLVAGVTAGLNPFSEHINLFITIPLFLLSLGALIYSVECMFYSGRISIMQSPEILSTVFQEKFSLHYVEAVNEWLKVNGKTAELEKYWGTVDPSAGQILEELKSSNSRSLSALLIANKELEVIVIDEKILGTVKTSPTTVTIEIYSGKYGSLRKA